MKLDKIRRCLPSDIIGYATLPDGMDSGAIYSFDYAYRYVLWRCWSGDEINCAFVGLNPSTATEIDVDNTVRRCVNFARAWGYGGMFMLNIFAYRATDPREMKAQYSPIGQTNNAYLSTYTHDCERVVAAWGNHGQHLTRSSSVLLADMIDRRWGCFGLTKQGEPKHPLYLPNNAELIQYKSRRGNTHE